jgi:hypothetical protein
MCSQVGHTASAPICQGTEAPKEEGYSKERQAESKFGGLWRGAPPGAMSTYLLNCRGLGNVATVRELRDFACELAPSILCVVEMQVHKSRETQVHKSRVECLAGTLGYDNVFVVSSTCHSGGLGIFLDLSHTEHPNEAPCRPRSYNGRRRSPGRPPRRPSPPRASCRPGPPIYSKPDIYRMWMKSYVGTLHARR